MSYRRDWPGRKYACRAVWFGSSGRVRSARQIYRREVVESDLRNSGNNYRRSFDTPISDRYCPARFGGEKHSLGVFDRLCERVSMKKASNQSRSISNAMRLGGRASSIAVQFAGPAGCGAWLDQTIETTPWFLLLGLACGSYLGFSEVLRLSKRLDS